MLKSALFAISLVLSGCSTLDPVPAHTKYGVHADVNPPGFYGVHSETERRTYRPFDDPAMKAAQCVAAPDYESLQDYIDYLIREAQQRCE